MSGGYDGSTVHADNMKYNPSTNTYTPLAPSPDQHFLGQGVYNPSNNKIYIPGGFGAAGQTNTMRIYDIASNTWTTGAPMPAAESDMATMIYNGIVYVAAGYNGGASSALYAYNIASNSWSTLASLPQAFYLPGFGAYNGKLYVASGNNGSTEILTLYIYDIASNTWTTGANIPTGTTGPASVIVNGKLWVIGGAAPFPTTTTMTQIYDIASNTWSVGPSMNVARLWFYAALAGNKVVAPGGDTQPGVPINDNETANAGGASCATATPGGATATPTQPAATPTCSPGGSHHILILYADGQVVPATLRTNLLAQSGVASVDTFDAQSGTPTVGQLQAYDIVVSFSNFGYADPVTLGNNLVTYMNGGGVVVAANFSWYGGSQSIQGTWLTGGYSPYNNPGTVNFGNGTLGTCTVPQLCNGVNTLNAYYREILTVASGATQGGTWNDNTSLMAYKGHALGVNAYLGDYANMWSGDFARLIVNAGNFLGGGGGCGTPLPTSTPGAATGTPTHTSTPGAPTATATCVAQAAGWTTGQALPTPIIRAVGVYFPNDGMFYSVGGRTSDTAGSDFQHVLQYNPSTNTWTQKGVTLPDNTMNNMACGVLTVSGTAQIYCVGGSAAGQTTATARVFSYNPATDTATVLNSADDWPGDSAGTVLPGGFAVTGNKLYILGGFNINTASTNQIWQFDPTQAQGSKWLQRVNTPEGIMYAPTAAINGMIYVAGASDYQGGTVVDTTNSFSFNPATNTIGNIMAIPRATGETRGLVVGGKMWVMGGGRVAPNPSNEVDIYDAGTNTWSVGTPFVNARRNFPADSDGSHVWLAGGYEPSTPAQDMEIYNPAVACGTATPTQPAATPTQPAATATTPPATATSPAATSTRPAATATSPAATSTRPAATATHTPAATPTHCTIQFTDVPVGSTFYPYIHCLACLGIVNGYADGTFRPNNNVTRGQLSKIVSNSAGFSDTPSGQQFQDVPIGSTFYVYIYRLVSRGYISGYPCGGPGEPCVPPDNLPYFRPNAYATRGQISKIVSNAAGFSDTPSGQQFQDVPVGSTFYDYIYRLVIRGIISGYPCGGPGEPCVPPANLPYFRPNNDATRGQMSKIDGLAFFPNCNIPARPQNVNQ
jgi:N-acetylneuraminic acid mutarotase